MTLIELQKVLGDRINVTLSDMTPEQKKIENEKTALVIGVAKQMVGNANTILKATKAGTESKELREVIGAAYLIGPQK